MSIKNRKMIFCGVCFLAMLSGCMTYNGQLDTSVPMTEQVTVVIHRPLTLDAVDNEEVNAGLVGWSPLGFATISMPAGEHELDLIYQSIITNYGGYRYEISGYSTIEYNFEPGYQYSIKPYTEVFGRRVSDVDTAIILELSKGFKVQIEKKKKSASGTLVAYETGVLMGASMGPIVRVGLNVGIIPLGLVVDTGKLSYGFDLNANMNVGWRPDPFEKEFGDEIPSGYHEPMGFNMELTVGGLFSVYKNKDNGKAFGFGIGGGYTTSYSNLLLSDEYPSERYPNVNPSPSGVWYIRGAVIPNRRTRFTIYFDYYLRNLNKASTLEDFNGDEGRYYSYLVDHPSGWYGWGLGLYVKLY